MAIFVDSDDRHFIGILYSRDGDRYSGNFVMASSRTVRLLNRIVVPLSLVLCLLVGLCFLAFAVERVVGPEEFFNFFFAAMAGIGCLVAIAYMAVGPLLLRRGKKRLARAKLQCLGNLSRWMYLLPLVNLVLVALAVGFMPAFSLAADGVFMLLILGPIFAGLVLAVIRYSAPLR